MECYQRLTSHIFMFEPCCILINNLLSWKIFLNCWGLPIDEEMVRCHWMIKFCIRTVQFLILNFEKNNAPKNVPSRHSTRAYIFEALILRLLKFQVNTFSRMGFWNFFEYFEVPQFYEL